MHVATFFQRQRQLRSPRAPGTQAIVLRVRRQPNANNQRLLTRLLDPPGLHRSEPNVLLGGHLRWLERRLNCNLDAVQSCMEGTVFSSQPAGPCNLMRSWQAFGMRGPSFLSSLSWTPARDAVRSLRGDFAVKQGDRDHFCRTLFFRTFDSW